MSKLQGVLKMFMLGMLKPYWKPCWSKKKRPSHFTARVKTERQISFFSFGLHELLKWDIFIKEFTTFIILQCDEMLVMDILKLWRLDMISFVFRSAVINVSVWQGNKFSNSHSCSLFVSVSMEGVLSC